MDKLLLLPSAKLVPPELAAEFGEIPSGMIPLDSRPALHHIIERYVGRGCDVVVAVHDDARLVSDYLSRCHWPSVETVDVGVTTSLGQTILQALECLIELPDELTVNFADTYVGDELQDGDAIYYQDVSDGHRWTTFTIGADGRLHDILDKRTDGAYRAPAHAFVGLFQIADPRHFKAILKSHIDDPGPVDPFYVAVVEYYNGRPSGSVRYLAVSDWRDFGHLDTYYGSKRAFFLNKRFFNEVRIDAARGVVHKSSSNGAKLLQELKWYLALPRPLQYVSPRILDYCFTQERPFIEMEYYGYPALNDVYLFGNLDTGAWERVFCAIEHVVEQMQRFHYQPAEVSSLVDAMRSMYVDKTRARLEPISKDQRFARFWADEVVINGQPCMGLGACLDALPSVAEELGMYDAPQFTVVHGDLCLSNILYDRRNCFVRLIDPRGEFGDIQLYGDYRYDLAKLCHSLEGDYDFFVNGMMDSGWKGDCFEFAPHLDARHVAIKDLFHRWIESRWSAQYAQLKFIESLLFLSMVPLHTDRFPAQEAFLARGLQTFTSVTRSQRVAVGGAYS
jgi:hypothetical protein